MHSQTLTPIEELTARKEKLQKHLAAQNAGGALILQNADLFYFSGTTQQCYLYVPAEGDCVLMARKDLDRARAESALSQVVPISSPREIPGILEDHGHPMPETMGLELDVLPTNQYFSFQRLFKPAELVDVSMAIRTIRAVKSDYEIGLIRKAAAMSDRLAAEVPGLLRENIAEVELSGMIEATARKWGHQGVTRMRLFGAELFYGHVMAGPSAAEPSYLASPTGGVGLSPAVGQGASMRAIGRNEPILVDMVFALDGYLSDHTRIFCMGEPDESLAAAHSAMLDIQEAVKAAAVPGTTAGELYDMAVARARSSGMADYFMGASENRIRFVGHGVGLEVDELPVLARGQQMPLEKNMVIALEPKAIFPGKGVVGIENTHVVTENGLEQLGTFREDIVVVDV